MQVNKNRFLKCNNQVQNNYSNLINGKTEKPNPKLIRNQIQINKQNYFDKEEKNKQSIKFVHFKNKKANKYKNDFSIVFPMITHKNIDKHSQKIIITKSNEEQLPFVQHNQKDQAQQKLTIKVVSDCNREVQNSIFDQRQMEDIKFQDLNIMNQMSKSQIMKKDQIIKQLQTKIYLLSQQLKKQKRQKNDSLTNLIKFQQLKQQLRQANNNNTKLTSKLLKLRQQICGFQVKLDIKNIDQKAYVATQDKQMSRQKQQIQRQNLTERYKKEIVKLNQIVRYKDIQIDILKRQKFDREKKQKQNKYLREKVNNLNIRIQLLNKKLSKINSEKEVRLELSPDG